MSVLQKNILTSLYNESSVYNGWEDAKRRIHLHPCHLRVIDPLREPYAIVKYTKNDSDFEQDLTKTFRSVIVHKDTGNIVSVAPFKSIHDYSWLGLESSKFQVQEFVDGTMMHVFRYQNNPIVISTRSNIGANNKFYNYQYDNSPTFADLLHDTGIDFESLLPQHEGANATFLSIVLQHPYNRIVVPVKQPKVYVIHYGYVKDGIVTLCHTTETIPSQFHRFLPKQYEDSSILQDGETSAIQYVETMGKQEKQNWQGIVIKNEKGVRYRLRSKEYTHVRLLRGNQANRIIRFLELRKEKSIKEYLTYYPEESDLYFKYEGIVRTNTRYLFNLYHNVFCTHQRQFSSLPAHFKKHVSHLHNVYKESLKPQEKTVTYEYVISYVNELDPTYSYFTLFKDAFDRLHPNVHIVPVEFKPSTEALRNAPPLPE